MVTKVQLNFTAKSGSQSLGLELPGEGVDPNPAYLSLAARCTGLDRRLVDPSAQSLAMLASWAAGAMVRLTHAQLTELTKQAVKYMRDMEASGLQYKSNAQYASLVIQECDRRAVRMDALNGQVGVVEEECVPVDFELWTNVSNLTESFVAQCVRVLMIQQGRGKDLVALEKSSQLLNTLFFVFTNPNPGRMTKSSQAVALLALYGAGASITLTQEQYRRLDSEVADYAQTLDPDSLPGDEADRPTRVRFHFLACFIRKLATDRAAQDGLRYGVIVPSLSLKALGLF